MLVFVSEFLCSGACSNVPLDDSLASEGKAMLLAILEDFARIPDCQIVTTLDPRLEGLSEQGSDWASRVIVHPCESQQSEQQMFQRLAREADATFVIAPEFDDCLASRRRLVDEANGRFLGSSLSAIQLCADKLALAHKLEEIQVATIPTLALDDHRVPWESTEVVVKPRCGAGSQATFQLQATDPLSAEIKSSGWQFIRQPYIAGTPLSVAVMSDGDKHTIFPVADQQISTDRRFHYLGSDLPSTSKINDSTIRAIVESIAAEIPGLDGFWGIDLLLTQDKQLLVVEINPRLTSSYLVYRQSARFNVAELILGTSVVIEWDAEPVRFRV
ncbi:MAG: hypothetical protein CMJ78_22635 [Planctomycetaceae bacterium]|nr:hypothetical protein [Planctomycetaceae bacterium]